MTTKIAVSLPDEQVKAAKRAVAGGAAASVSALVSAALADKLQHDDLAAVVADLVLDTEFWVLLASRGGPGR